MRGKRGDKVEGAIEKAAGHPGCSALDGVAGIGVDAGALQAKADEVARQQKGAGGIAPEINYSRRVGRVVGEVVPGVHYVPDEVGQHGAKEEAQANIGEVHHLSVAVDEQIYEDTGAG